MNIKKIVYTYKGNDIRWSYNKRVVCKNCKKKGAFTTTEALYYPSCYDCLANTSSYTEIRCDICSGQLSERASDGSGYSTCLFNCKCNNKEKKPIIKLIKEKRITESQWVRVRDYQ